MEPEEIKALLQVAIEGSEVEVTVDCSHAHLVVISEAFSGLGPVKRQQLVYGALSEQIADGRIHAVHMKTFTPDQVPN